MNIAKFLRTPFYRIPSMAASERQSMTEVTELNGRVGTSCQRINSQI